MCLQGGANAAARDEALEWQEAHVHLVGGQRIRLDDDRQIDCRGEGKGRCCDTVIQAACCSRQHQYDDGEDVERCSPHSPGLAAPPPVHVAAMDNAALLLHAGIAVRIKSDLIPQNRVFWASST